MSKTNDEKSITIEPDLEDVFPLPLRVVPEPWEDLASLLSRTAGEMGYKKVSWLLRPEDCAYSRLDPDVCFLLQDAAYQYLGHLLQLSEESLYKLTFHRFLTQMQAAGEVQPSPTGYLQRPLFLPNVHGTRKLFLSKLASRVCPRCLAEEPAYGVLYWNIGPVVACLKHHIFLVDCCPHCQGKIPLLRAVLTHCPRCSIGDYRLAPTVDLPEEPLFLSSQALILAHLGVEEEYRGGVTTVHGESPLYRLLPWQYFQLLKSFRNILNPFFPNHPLIQKVAGPPIPSGRRACLKTEMSLGEWAAFMSTFHTLFASWPDNFAVLLESLPSIHFNTSARKSSIRQFGVLYQKYLYIRLRDPAFDFLREAFEDYLKKRYTGGRVSTLRRPFIGKDSMEIATQCTYVTLDQVMQLLGVSHQNLHTLISRGVIRTIKKPRSTKGKDRLWLIEKVDAEALLEEWKDLLSLDDLVRNYLGVSKQQVYALTSADLLHPVRGRDLDRSLIRYYKRGELERLKAQLLQYADKDVPSASENIPLSKSTKRIGLPLVEILKEILGGHLVVIDTEREIPLFQRLVLSDSEVKRFREEHLRAERSDLNLLSARDVMKSLGVGHGTLREWMRQGVLVGECQRVKGMIHGYLFQRDMVDLFRRSYVFTKEAAEILNVHSNTIYKYVSRGILHPVGLSRFRLFLREEVEALTSPDTLSIP